jgi:hypothetical protein
MEKQTLTFTALPNGFAPDGTARLSVFVAPRLWSDAPGAANITLDQYPDMLEWPSRVSALVWEASIDGGPALPLTLDKHPLKPTLWAALFHDTTEVKPFRFEDYRGTPIETFPTWAIHDTIAGLYGRASSEKAYGAGRDRPDLGILAVDVDLSAIARPSFPEPEPQWNSQETAPIPFPDAPPVEEKPEPEPTPPPTPAPSGCGCGCLGWPLALLRRLFGLPGNLDANAPVSPEPPSSKPAPTPSFKTEVTPPATPPPPAPGKSFLPPPLTPAQQQTRAAFDSLDAFLKPFDGAEPPLPDAAKLAETWDFHQAVASLGDYPVILRRLGLVVDLLLPPGTPLPATGTIRISATGVTWQPGTTVVRPRTHFVSTAALFTAAPRPVQPEISNGFLRVDDTARFRVIQNDVPGDAVKLRNAATHFLRFALPADRPGNLPGAGGLPALRTAGISLVRHEIVAELAGQFQRSCALNRFLAAQDLSPEPPPVADTGAPPAPSDELYAEDLVRGYRIDVLDTKTGKWRSLFERTGEYRFLEAVGGSVTETAADEGFVQFAATEPRDPAAPKSIRTGETLFTWNGWSLAAPRPGKAIMPDDTHADPPNAAVTPFKIETEFKAKTGSLPRLRFGRRYRLRARVADLAGNSVTKPDEVAFDVDVPEITPEFTAVRYEPLAPPILMLQAAPVEGESVERLVIRTPAIGGLGTTTARHVAPPKTSQLMAELHGKFDNANVDGSPVGYALASHESKSVKDDAKQTKPAHDGLPGEVPAVPAESDPWFQSASLLTVTYLPDPQARGVALTGLPGELAPETARSILFGNSWPNLKAFRIELTPPAGTKPGVPKLVGDTLTVELAPAQRATVRINSVMDPADLESRGVWKWTDDLAPANLTDVKNSVLEGRHWAHLPWREIILLHAVQQPLEAPKITALAVDPPRKLGETFAILKGDIVVDAPSTARVQLLAKWTDPTDDPPKQPDDPPKLPGFQTQNAHVCEIEVPEGVSPVGVNDSGTKLPPKHEFHDTKYHRVDYTPVAVTRFREYFPPVSNTPATTTAPGVDFSIDVLNSARPAAPKFLYALPLFEWDTPPRTAGITKRRRGGGGLRIYLDRPWFSSGDGELLGIVFQEGVDFLTIDDALKPFVTQWGADPVWDAAPTSARAEKAHFKTATNFNPMLSLAELPATVSVAGYPVNFDSVRQLRFADIRIETADAYWPFVRLALARFQPNSIDDAHLSRVFRSDFIQLPPRRDAEIVIGAAAIHLKVTGPVYLGSEVTGTIPGKLSAFGGSPGSNGLSEIEAVIEQRDPADDPVNELSWEPIEATRAVFFQNPSAPGMWKGDVTLTVPLAPGLFRLTLKELEWFRTDDARSVDAPRDQIQIARRVVYADCFAL